MFHLNNYGNLSVPEYLIRRNLPPNQFLINPSINPFVNSTSLNECNAHQILNYSTGEKKDQDQVNDSNRGYYVQNLVKKKDKEPKRKEDGLLFCPICHERLTMSSLVSHFDEELNAFEERCQRNGHKNESKGQTTTTYRRERQETLRQIRCNRYKRRLGANAIFKRTPEQTEQAEDLKAKSS